MATSDRASDIFDFFKNKFGLLATALLSRALVGLELDELLGHVVVVALGEDAQHGEACLVHVDAFTQRQPAGDAAFGGHVLELQDGHANGAVLSRKAVVLHTHLQLVALRAHLVTQSAAAEKKVNNVLALSFSTTLKESYYGQFQHVNYILFTCFNAQKNTSVFSNYPDLRNYYFSSCLFEAPPPG